MTSALPSHTHIDTQTHRCLTLHSWGEKVCVFVWIQTRVLTWCTSVSDTSVSVNVSVEYLWNLRFIVKWKLKISCFMNCQNWKPRLWPRVIQRCSGAREAFILVLVYWHLALCTCTTVLVLILCSTLCVHYILYDMHVFIHLNAKRWHHTVWKTCSNVLKTVSVKVYFSGKASAEVCLENMKQIAEHAYFICLSGLVWSGRSNKSGFTSFINTHTHTHAEKHTNTPCWQLCCEECAGECTRGTKRQREWAEGREWRLHRETWQWDLILIHDVIKRRSFRWVKMNNNDEYTTTC